MVGAFDSAKDHLNWSSSCRVNEHFSSRFVITGAYSVQEQEIRVLVLHSSMTPPKASTPQSTKIAEFILSLRPLRHGAGIIQDEDFTVGGDTQRQCSLHNEHTYESTGIRLGLRSSYCMSSVSLD